MQVWPLQTRVLPVLDRTPGFAKAPVVDIGGFVPALREFWLAITNAGRLGDFFKNIPGSAVHGVDHACFFNRYVIALKKSMPSREDLSVNFDDAVLVRAEIPFSVVIFQPGFDTIAVVIQGALHGIGMVER